MTTGTQDPLNFSRADHYFRLCNDGNWAGPTELLGIDTIPPAGIEHPENWRGVTLQLGHHTYCEDPIQCDNARNVEINSGKTRYFKKDKCAGKTLVVVQFIRPTLWRVRYDPTVIDRDQYGDENSRTIVGDYTSSLINILDKYLEITWDVALDDSQSGRWVLSSAVKTSTKAGSPYKKGDGMELHLYKKPFRIEAFRTLASLTPGESPKKKLVWQTTERTFRYKLDLQHDMLKDVVLEVIRPPSGKYIGWGSQGGISFVKPRTQMNYFNTDNMKYSQVYGGGPLNPSEPLYHSDPYWMDVNSNEGYRGITGSFVDNYSQIAIDFGATNADRLAIGTRFGGIDIYLISADTAPDIVRLYTSIVGRSYLKPRYILGSHQACYGYLSKKELLEVVKQYRDSKIPLDGLHIDVDLQDNGRTFTINEQAGRRMDEDTGFPDPKGMFDELRGKGVKCSTNITPVIGLNQSGARYKSYKTLEDGLEKRCFIRDDRYTNGTTDASGVKYVVYQGGNQIEKDPKTPHMDGNHPRLFTGDNGDSYQDNYNFIDHYNKSKFYHGGVYYGFQHGTPGHYSDLNRKCVRRWWGQQYEYLFRMGLEFVWQDMTTPAIELFYGDMKGLPTRLWVNAHSIPGVKKQEKKLAMEVWALYSYNLHKATFHGLSYLPSREGKRNFILGRGSFAGMYRYAGLWSGDNESSWDFWKITISQVLSVGLNGVSISGSDTGGFEPIGSDHYCDPELLIRWYAGSFLLPWFRNHYVKKKFVDDYEGGNRGDRKKWFQEPYAYPIHFESNRNQSGLRGLAYLYYGAQHISQYYLQLRYALLQLLYDTMFENQIHGLPIARSLLLTDHQDHSLLTDNSLSKFLDDQYIVGRDLLIAPIMNHEQKERKLYLPKGYSWHPSNLRPSDNQRVPLEKAVAGGIYDYGAPIPNPGYNDDDETRWRKPDPKGYPYVTPIYIREGAIIPQIEVRQYVHDYTTNNGDGEAAKPNPIKFNIYPQSPDPQNQKKPSEYTTYLDDGVSTNSEPSNGLRSLFAAEASQRQKIKAEEKEAQLKRLTVAAHARGPDQWARGLCCGAECCAAYACGLVTGPCEHPGQCSPKKCCSPKVCCSVREPCPAKTCCAYVMKDSIQAKLAQDRCCGSKDCCAVAGDAEKLDEAADWLEQKAKELDKEAGKEADPTKKAKLQQEAKELRTKVAELSKKSRVLKVEEKAKREKREERDRYRAVTLRQKTESNSRTITITKKLDKQYDYSPEKETGKYYTLVFWYEKGTPGIDRYTATVEGTGPSIQVTRNTDLSLVEVKVEETLGQTEKVIIKVASS